MAASATKNVTIATVTQRFAGSNFASECHQNGEYLNREQVIE